MEKSVPIKYGDEILIKESQNKTKMIRINPEPLYEKEIRHDVSHQKYNASRRKYYH